MTVAQQAHAGDLGLPRNLAAGVTTGQLFIIAGDLGTSQESGSRRDQFQLLFNAGDLGTSQEPGQPTAGGMPASCKHLAPQLSM